MGTWSASINENDTAQDLITEYRIAFATHDVETALQLIESYAKKEFDFDDELELCNYVYSLADFMWKKGILTDLIKDRAIKLIDNNCGLEEWKEEGEKELNKRLKVLEEFKNKLLSPQPPKKKITINLYTKEIFEIGDIIALQLNMKDVPYEKSDIDWHKLNEEEYYSYDKKYVVLIKVNNIVDFTSSVDPSVKDIWPEFRIYKKVFDHVPNMNELENEPLVFYYDQFRLNVYKLHISMGTFSTEGNIRGFKKRNYQIIGKTSREDLLQRTDYSEQINLNMKYPEGSADIFLVGLILELF